MYFSALWAGDFLFAHACHMIVLVEFGNGVTPNRSAEREQIDLNKTLTKK